MSFRRPATLALILALPLAAFAAGGSWSVQVRQCHLRQKPSFLAPIAATLPYGMRVEGIEERGDWRLVRSKPYGEGWIHASAITEKKISLKAGEENVGTAADEEEIALAGKGFNKEVEGAYRTRHGQAAYDVVDAMEARGADDAEVAEFLRQGGLRETEARP